MKKHEALDLFGSGAALARAIGVSRSLISQWPDPLTQKQADRVMGAALRLGKVPREKFKRSQQTNSKRH